MNLKLSLSITTTADSMEMYYVKSTASASVMLPEGVTIRIAFIKVRLI